MANDKNSHRKQIIWECELWREIVILCFKLLPSCILVKRVTEDGYLGYGDMIAPS